MDKKQFNRRLVFIGGLFAFCLIGFLVSMFDAQIVHGEEYLAQSVRANTKVEVVETSRGIEMGRVVTGAREVDDEQIVAPLKQVLRIATPEDIERDRTNEIKEREAHRICVDKIAYR